MVIDGKRIDVEFETVLISLGLCLRPTLVPHQNQVIMNELIRIHRIQSVDIYTVTSEINGYR